MRHPTLTAASLVLALTASEAAFAYVGPGAGLSLLGALWGLIAAIGAAVLFVILWPLRQARKRRQAKRVATHDPAAEAEAARGARARQSAGAAHPLRPGSEPNPADPHRAR
jgi:Na+/proline symporter